MANIKSLTLTGALKISETKISIKRTKQITTEKAQSAALSIERIMH